MNFDPLGPHGSRARAILAAGARLGRAEVQAIDRFWQHLPNAAQIDFWTARNGVWEANRTGGVRRGRLQATEQLVNNLHSDFTWYETSCAQLLEGAVMAELELGLSEPVRAALGGPWRKACAATGQAASLD